MAGRAGGDAVDCFDQLGRGDRLRRTCEFARDDLTTSSAEFETDSEVQPMSRQ